MTLVLYRYLQLDLSLKFVAAILTFGSKMLKENTNANKSEENIEMNMRKFLKTCKTVNKSRVSKNIWCLNVCIPTVLPWTKSPHKSHDPEAQLSSSIQICYTSTRPLAIWPFGTAQESMQGIFQTECANNSSINPYMSHKCAFSSYH